MRPMFPAPPDMPRHHVAASASPDTGDSLCGGGSPSSSSVRLCWLAQPRIFLIGTGLILPNQILDQQTRINKQDTYEHSPPRHLEQLTIRSREELSAQGSHLNFLST